MVLVHSSGIYAYSREHALAARRKNRAEITDQQLREIKLSDSKKFIDLQTSSGFDFISDGQFLWKDLARPFHGKGAEEDLEMVRRADTNTFTRRPNVSEISDIKNADLQKFLLNSTKNQQVALLGPYSYGQYANRGNGVAIEEVQAAYAKAAAQSLAALANNGVAHILISEPVLGEKKVSADAWLQESEALKTIKSSLKNVSITLGFYYYSAEPAWQNLLELPVDNIAVDLRPRDYFSPIPAAETLIDDFSFLFQSDTKKGIILGAVNGRNGGFTPNKGLETPEWIADVVKLANKQNDRLKFGITFSTDETILPRGLADAKLKNIGAAKKLLAAENL